MSMLFRKIKDLFDDVAWQVWYQDTFDRECPRQVEVEGVGLVKGLTELWARHLHGTIRPDGQKGFSLFNLWCPQNHQDIEIIGAMAGQVQLRQWIFGQNKSRGEGDYSLLSLVATVHGSLIHNGQNSEPILALVRNSNSLQDFKKRLSALAKI
ncbi:hypothetical protein ACFL27_21355 [candidate division CSSED10-310 bacterium]|uniref:Uncharacterized protein n=1 Tax=candidate division CSSED10-310 bacterium TaxID=2855610 RepID=A0ABV6Z2T4_UNCC1